jgi:hypothetical protein
MTVTVLALALVVLGLTLGYLIGVTHAEADRLEAEHADVVRWWADIEGPPPTVRLVHDDDEKPT